MQETITHRHRKVSSRLLLAVAVAICHMLLVTLLASCSKAAEHSDPSKWKPGQVLSEKVNNLGNGYKEVHRSVVNAPGHWEGVGHFSFIYFKDMRLCQCSADDVSISPDGRYAIFVKEDDGHLTLFDAKSSVTRALTTEFVGTPHFARWDLKEGNVVVSVRKWMKEKNDYNEKEIPVQLLPLGK